jgi:NADH:ubiquinone oxidoreductase subunit F (NADH-binding)
MENFQLITQHWGNLDPFKIEDYLNVNGYQALKKIIQIKQPEKIIQEVKKARLVGRGGAGFSTGKKWEMVAKKKGKKYFIGNLDESEPGTYKDRALCDNNPHLLLEGIILGALAVGAEKAYIYLNGNYEKQRRILKQAIRQAQEKHFLGKNILGSEYNLMIEVFSGAGAYICGEESALINSLEGRRGEPQLRPPYPTEKGLFGYPTVVNNAETLANVPWIINYGGEKYCEIGSAVSPGTKLFILGGAIKKPGIVEAPTGITIQSLIYTEGGGLPLGKDFWFAQIGGAGGRLVLENELNIPLDFKVNSQYPLGSGAILVVDKSVNIYDLLISWTSFFRRESCGKCVPGREGTFRLYEIMQRLQDGEISKRDKQAVKDILWTLKNTTFCPMGKFAATAVSDAIKKLKIFDKNYANKNKC